MSSMNLDDMGFVFEGLYEHEGRVVAVLPDGSEGDEIWEVYDGEDPARPKAKYLTPRCSCGWQGTSWVVNESGAAAAQTEWQEQHIAPLAQRTPPEDLVHDAETLRRQINDLVGSRPLQALALLRKVSGWAKAYTARAAREARTEGRSWEDIGDQLGISKQAAQQRFRDRSDPEDLAP